MVWSEAPTTTPETAIEGPVSVGVVGAGWIASVIHLPVLDALDATEIGFVADADGTRAGEMADQFGGEPVAVTDGESLPPCDVALLAVPVGARREYVREFGDRGTPVFAEKPYAPDADTHRDFLELLPATACNYMRTGFGALNQARELYRTGVFGSLDGVRIAESVFSGATGRGPDHYLSDVELGGGGVLMERGCHSLSQLEYLLPEHDVRVGSATFEWEGDHEIDVSARLEATDGDRTIPVEFDLSMLRSLGSLFELRFDSTVVRFDPSAPDARLTLCAPDGSEFPLEPDDRWATESVLEAVYLRWKDFLLAVTTGEPLPSETATGLKTTEIISALYGRTDRREVSLQ